MNPDHSITGLGNKKRSFTWLMFLLLFLVSGALTFIVHPAKNELTWQGELYGDRAGYYIYLPAAFLYNFDATGFPKEISTKIGRGFFINGSGKKFETHYFYGVALMVSPFFLTTHLISIVLNIDEEHGFSVLYHRMIDIAGVVYLILGLWFLSKFLRYYLKPKIVFFTILATFLGTNLMYYGIIENMMSHIYSFFTISAFLYFMKVFLDKPERFSYFLLLCLFVGLMLVIRPTNILAATAFLFWDIDSGKEILRRIRLIIKPKHLLALVVIVFILVFPQFLFYKYLYGSYTHIRYGAGFSNWNHPRFAGVWFASLNGLILYAPVMIFFLVGGFIMIKKRIPNGWFIAILFLVVSYIAAAYTFWDYGCGYGHRAFIEFLPVFSVAFGYFAEWLGRVKNLFIRFSILILIICMVYVNARRTFTYNHFFAGSTWDWEQYIRDLNKSGILIPEKIPYSFSNDFENCVLTREENLSDSVNHSGGHSVFLNPEIETAGNTYLNFYEFTEGIPAIARVSIWCRVDDMHPTGARILFNIERNGKTISTQELKIDSTSRNPFHWYKVEKSFQVPEQVNSMDRIHCFVYNPDRHSFFIDDLKIKFE